MTHTIIFNRIYNTLFGSPKIFITEVNDDMRSYLKQLTDLVVDIDVDNNLINNLNDIKIGLETYAKDIGIEYIQDLHSELSGFIYNYQKAIPFDKTPYIQCLQPTSKYCFKKGLRIIKEDSFYNAIIYEKWPGEAVNFLDGKKDLTNKILDIYSELDYHYNYPETFNRKTMQKRKFKMNKNGIIENTFGEEKTLYDIMCDLITYQEGIYNDNSNTREWGLYNSSFYYIVKYIVLTKIVHEIETAIKWEKDEDVYIPPV